jgi:hypothetical protein
VKTSSKAWGIVVTGYSTAAVALVAFLTINGVSGIPTAAIIGTGILIAIGLLLPIAGMLQLRKGLGSIKSAGRYGFAMQAFGLLGLLFAVVLVVGFSSLTGYLISALFVTTAGVSSISGAVLLRAYFINSTKLNAKGVLCLIFGTGLIFSGVALIVGSNIAFQYFISQLENTVYVDIGATISSCGCVLTAYSFYVLYNRR